METPFIYWPFDEVELSFEDNKENVVVKTPWMQAKIPSSHYDPEFLDILIEKFATDSIDPQTDLELVNGFFADFHEYPLCYVLPTPKDGDISTDEHQIADQNLDGLPLKAYLATVLAQHPGFASDDVEECLNILPRDEWSWDAEAAIGFANCEGKVHPESLLSVARRFHFLEVAENSESQEIFEGIEKLEGDQFRKAARLLVRQNHYVTQKCQEALIPAVEISGQASDEVNAFIKEEQGHDLILGVAMKAMAEDPEQIPATVQTRILMKLLEFAASRNFLGFAMAIDAFERSSYEKIDPLANLLIKGGYEKAANQINRHMQINDAGGHENVAVGFLKWMKPCESDYATEALRLAEIITLVMNSVIKSAVIEFKRDH